MFDWLPTISLPQRLYSVPLRYIIILAIVTLLLLSYAFLYVPPTSLAFTYSGPSCTKQITILPDFQSQSDENFVLSYDQLVNVGSVNMAALKVCASPIEPLQQGEHTLHTSAWWDWLAHKSYVIDVSAPPRVSLDPLDDPIPLAKPVELPMSAADEIHSYKLHANSRNTECANANRLLTCHLDDLALNQGEVYEFAVVRYFDDEEVEQVEEQEVEVLKAVQVVTTSIATDETVFSKPQEVSIEFDKPVNQVEAALHYAIDGELEEVEVEVVIDTATATVSWSEELPRETEISMTIHLVEAVDGSSLVEPHTLRFRTSGGPKVTGVTIPQSGVEPNAAAVITFDQVLDQFQDLNALVSVEGGLGVASLGERSVTVQLGGLEKCARFTMRVSGDVMSLHGVRGGSEWSYEARTTCRSVETIGYSVQGRPILAYIFGSGDTTILYTGAIHGNELSSSYLVDHWMRELEANYDHIPNDRRIVVVPEVNPDGVANGTRTNANGVDLNRNFAVSDWQKDITDVYGEPMPGGGGSTSMSEPETQALAELTKRLKPRLTMSFHSIGGVVIANQAADSTNLAQAYARLSGYQHATGQSSEVFDYAITGTYDDWIAESLKLPSVLVELGSHTYSQFPQNKAALWEMTKR